MRARWRHRGPGWLCAQRAAGAAASLHTDHTPCSLSAGWHLACAQRQVSAYLERFRAVLSPSNAQQVQLLLRVAAALLARLAGRGRRGAAAAAPGASAAEAEAAAAATAQGPRGGGGGGACVCRVNQLLFDLGLDNINMFHLLRWIRETKFAFKVRCRCLRDKGPELGGGPTLGWQRRCAAGAGDLQRALVLPPIQFAPLRRPPRRSP